MLELLTILLIFSLGVILLIAVFIGGIWFTFTWLKRAVRWLFGGKKN